MSYATLDDLKKTLAEAELIKLCNDSGGTTFDAPAQAVAQRALDDATSEIDEELANQAAMLLTADRRRQLCVDIAAFRLVTRRALDTEKGPYAARRKAYEDAITFLRRKADEARLKETAGAGIAAGVSSDRRVPVFAEDALDGL